jgi:hypothetical protein
LASNSNSSVCDAVFLRFRPCPCPSTEASSASATGSFGFRPRRPLPLVALVASFSARCARAAQREKNSTVKYRPELESEHREKAEEMLQLHNFESSLRPTKENIQSRPSHPFARSTSRTPPA